MKKKKLFIFGIIICISFVGAVFLFNGNSKVSDKIMDFYDAKEETAFVVKLSDYTDFDWDYVIVYKNPITTNELNEITGIDYKKELDLQSGMIFTKDDEIVYEEFFETDFESPYKFIIYPYVSTDSEIRVNRFSKENAVFECEKSQYGNKNVYTAKGYDSLGNEFDFSK